MTRNIIALIGFALLAGCGGGGGDSATPSSAPAPLAQPDMLTATSQGLLRGKANGQGQRLMLAKSNLHKSIVVLSKPNVFYTTRAPNDIWTVRTDGTGDRAVVNTSNAEFIRTVNGSWLIYGESIPQPSGRLVDRYGSVNIDTGEQFQFDDSEGTNYRPQNTSRLISTTSQQQISSLTVTGADRLTYASLTTEEQTVGTFLDTHQLVGDALIYSRSASLRSGSYSRTYTIPLGGGTAALLDEERYDTYSAWSIGSRVVYHRRAPFPDPSQQADVVSIQNNGTNRVVLASNPANEAVQGVTTNHVVIRRNLSGDDHLIVVPINGGPEKLLMVMTNDEFVELITGDLLIVRRPSGTWTLDLNGALKQIGTETGDYGFMSIGNAVCMNKGEAVWCMPLDGSGPQVKIADEGKIVGVL